MGTEEDEAFDAVERAQGWRKRQIADQVQVDVDPYTTKVRNDAIEEVAKAIEKFKGAFGQSTTDSFACFVRGMKR
jgi:patatin-like phospholipase/acyl hydrolase